MKPTEFVVREHVAARRLYRGRLFRKYFLLILLLVCGTLVISGGIGLYFAYQENKVALASLQREKAGAAAARIEQFVHQIERQVAFAALLPLGPDLEQRRVEFLKVLKLSPEVTDIAQLDARGREQVLVSRLRMEAMRSGEDRSGERAFKEVRGGQTWFGPVTFRKDTEPYMSIAVRAGASGPVTIADVNLKFMWDVIQRIKIGEKGKAYVIDGTGHLIADPDIGLVLRKTDLSGLEQVKAALSPDADDALAMLARDHAGNAVLTAYAPIEPRGDDLPDGRKRPPLGWKVFVEQPVSEVFAALDATILRTVGLLVAGLLFSALAAMSLARSMVRPISTLQEGAARIGAGDLEQKIEVKTGDELESLADEFNQMSAQLRESYAGLEKKVEERTAELQQALEFQGASGEILSSISGSMADTKPVFDAIVRNLMRMFGTRYGVVHLLRDGQLHIASHKGDPETEADFAKVYPRPVDGQTLLAQAVETGKVMQLAPIIGNPQSPPKTLELARCFGWNALLIAPMRREDKVIGAISTGRRAGTPFDDKQVALIKAFADQAVIAIENARLFNETKEALEQQTATSEILKVISSSTTDTQPVFESIVRSGLNLFPDAAVAVVLPDGDKVRMTAVASSDPGIGQAMLSRFPIPLTREYMHGVAILDRQLVDVPDGEQVTETSLTPGIRNFLASGARAITIMPMMRGDTAIGAISVTRVTAGALSEKQVALLRTFADQAVIAIENVRLFNETKEALERQTATAEVLSVISSSPTDTQPVFDAILQSATQLCDAETGILFRYDDGAYTALATRVSDPKLAELFKQPRRPAPGSKNGLGRLRDERRAVHIPDMMNDTAHAQRDPLRMESLQGGMRSWLGVPMLKEGELIGAIVIYRGEPRRFTEQQIALLQVFGDQAVIAVENVRLFNETRESLEQQTAISEILRAISASPSDVNPVLQAVAERAARICEAPFVDIIVRDGGQISSAASIGSIGRPPQELNRETAMGRSILDRDIVHVPDMQNASNDEFALGRKLALQLGHRTTLAVPLLRDEEVLGTILLRRAEVRPFEDKYVALLKTFADQAAIAIENVRLFNETKEALEQQTATAEVLNVISGSITDASPVFDAISRSVLKLYGGRSVGLYVRMGERIDRVGYALADKSADDGTRALWPMPLDDRSLTGRAILGGDLVHIKDVESEPGLSEHSREITRKSGVRSVLIAPMQSMGTTTGALSVGRRAIGGFSEREVELIRTFADQAVIAMENVRLFREIQDKSAQLEVANKHKSDFLANMSHELRTPLNAIIGFSEVLIEKMFGEVNAKQADYLKDIHESGRHLLSLINDILDLSKIEAGRMDLEISAFDLPSALSNAMTLVRERAQRHGIKLGLEVDKRLGEFRADERKFKQIVVNLLSNAVKFTPDGGKVDVNARLDTDKIEIAVKDTGIGIAPEDHAAVFEEFKQAGRDHMRKSEGTGLGLALTKRFVELHGGDIRLESALGKGSTFTITLPLRTS